MNQTTLNKKSATKKKSRFCRYCDTPVCRKCAKYTKRSCMSKLDVRDKKIHFSMFYYFTYCNNLILIFNNYCNILIVILKYVG